MPELLLESCMSPITCRKQPMRISFSQLREQAMEQLSKFQSNENARMEKQASGLLQIRGLMLITSMQPCPSSEDKWWIVC